MINVENTHWELLNNEIRHVEVDESRNEVALVTAFRSIQNRLVFENVSWSQLGDELIGGVINYVEEAKTGEISGEETDIIRGSYFAEFEADYLEKTGNRLYRLVCNKNTLKRLLICEDMRIVING